VNATTTLAVPRSSLVTWTHVIYGLHAFSLFNGVTGPATVIGMFLTGWPSLLAVVFNYVKRGEAGGTWLESHFRWQIRTFWFGLLWCAVAAAFVAATLGIGLIVVWIPLGMLALWFLYRIGRGWLALAGGNAMYR